MYRNISWIIKDKIKKNNIMDFQWMYRENARQLYSRCLRCICCLLSLSFLLGCQWLQKEFGDWFKLMSHQDPSFYFNFIIPCNFALLLKNFSRSNVFLITSRSHRIVPIGHGLVFISILILCVHIFQLKPDSDKRTVHMLWYHSA